MYAHVMRNAKKAALLEDPSFWRFIDWVLFTTDNRLAHVVLVTSSEVSNTLDAFPGWRARRQKVHIDYPRTSTVANYMQNVVNPLLVQRCNAQIRGKSGWEGGWERGASSPSPLTPAAAAAPGAVAAALPPPHAPHDWRYSNQLKRR